MLEFFRRHRGAFMLTLTVIVIISFASWGGNRTDGRQAMASVSDDAFTMYGETYSIGELQRLQTTGQIMMSLGMYDLYVNLMNAASSPEARGENFAFNLVVLKQQMKELGISPSDEDAKAELAKTPSLQENGVFSPQKAHEMEMNLGRFGMGGQAMLDVAKLNIGLNAIKDLIGKNYVPSPVQVEKTYASRHQTLKVQTIDFNLNDFKKAAVVKDEEIQKYFDENKDTYKSTEKRAVSYVLFANPVPPVVKPEDEAKKTEEDRKKAADTLKDQQKAQVDAVNAFANAAAEGKKFDAIVADQKLKAETAALFAKDSPPEALKGEEDLVSAIFANNPASRPISNSVKGTKGYYIFTVTKVEESKPQDLAAVKDKVKEVLVGQKAKEAMSKAVNDARTAIQEGLKAGKKVEDIAKEKKLVISPVKELTVDEPANDIPNAVEIAREAQNVAAGEVSKAVDINKGESAVIAYVAAKELRKRDNSADLRKNVDSSVGDQERQRLFNSWFAAKHAEAGLKLHLKARESA